MMAIVDNAGAGAVSGVGVEDESSGGAGDGGVIGDRGVVGCEAHDSSKGGKSADVSEGCSACNGIEKGEIGAAAGGIAGLEGSERTSSSLESPQSLTSSTPLHLLLVF
jgi:hypothetical protein